MLPLQITLEGFMSYCDKATISFEGASLWMLAGGNGAGKSTIFDAMRWTIFGAHRGGRSGNEALIHRDREKLRVAFDLGLGDEKFRLLRTLSRTGRSTWQIEKLHGEQTEKVPETDGREGYETWLREHIGLSDETFCAAMYLAQGRGDAILGASPAQRYEMLREIVDISAYASLHERARSRALELESEARQSEKSWQNAPDSPAEEIEVLGEELASLSAQIARDGARREEILRLEPLAAHWQEVETQRIEAQKVLEKARQSLDGAPQTERDFARLNELETLLPPLESYAQTRERLAQNALETQNLLAILPTSQKKLQRAEVEIQSAKTTRGELESAQKTSENARLNALSELNALAPQLANARQIGIYQRESAALETEIAAFPAGLKGQIRASQFQIERAENQKIAADILRRFGREKALFQDAHKVEVATQSEIARLEKALPATKNEEHRCFQALEMAREAQSHAVKTLSAAATRRVDAEAARARFEEVRGESNCYFCGQTLTPEHTTIEVARLQNALQPTKIEEAQARQALKAQDRAAQNAKNQLENAQIALRNRENELEKSRGLATNAQNSAGHARVSATAILQELSAQFAARFDENDSRNWDESRVERALNGDFPASQDLETLRNESQNLNLWRQQLHDLIEQEAALQKIAARLSDRENQLAPLRAALGDAALAALQSREIALQTSLQKAISEQENGALQRQKIRETVLSLEKSREAAQLEIAQLESRIAALKAAQIEIARALSAANSPLLSAFFELEEELRAELSQLQNEMSRLESGDLRARAAALSQAQTRITDLEHEVSRLGKSALSVPLAARRSPPLLQLEAQNLKVEIENAEGIRRETSLEKFELERRREAKSQLEKANLAAQNAARRHKTLADLLGPHQLQRYLLREAENGILDEANVVLDRISSGTLRLELRADDDEIAGARKGAPKVLDLAVFRADDAGRGPGMLPAFLSGSQRFRVAVALALGIGRYATHGGGTRLEAVIIDEGFGSLDKIGRGEMIDELKMLGHELKRVILVSHQEEFADAFSNRYLIENDGTTSTARLLAS
ncbi:DNA repair exonuclease SbcCD ATPase subunit [Abditibacterium utsteinense]|uniref:DNA repair exonuclease SbcCD ATPase subunit n=1 Tax=Abditibacterium utsteinense TaxID=1960156 RepID=A0A2S8SRA6_9BACT|nr:SMC family ATPase [Abditibacterium utsteinense]PQV63327.1 DNA repair exonuclease SbcCD ATPase subunit [Abditibacterium utsteinense]